MRQDNQTIEKMSVLHNIPQDIKLTLKNVIDTYPIPQFGKGGIPEGMCNHSATSSTSTPKRSASLRPKPLPSPNLSMPLRSRSSDERSISIDGSPKNRFEHPYRHIPNLRVQWSIPSQGSFSSGDLFNPQLSASSVYGRFQWFNNL